MGRLEQTNVRVHSNVPYVVKAQHGLEKDNTIIVKNDKGLLNKLRKKLIKQKHD